MSSWTPAPWSEGKWEWIDSNSYGGHVLSASGEPILIEGRASQGAGVTLTANAELIALAPELAEAIMLWSDATEEDCRIKANDMIEALAVKLRQIGGDNE